MRIFPGFALLAVAALVMVPAFGEVSVSKKAKGPAAKVPTGMVAVPVPVPNVPACTTGLEQTRTEAKSALEKFKGEVQRSAPSASATEAADMAVVTSVHAWCCALLGVATPGQNYAAGDIQCSALMTAVGAKGATYSLRDNVRACQTTGVAAANASKAAQAALTGNAKVAAERLHRADRALTTELAACASAIPITASTSIPAVNTPKAVGATCTANEECATFACMSGHCSVLGVPAGGSCDATHFCGPLLECRSGTCLLPCACLAPCYTDGGACVENKPRTRTVRKDCNDKWFCGLPCFKDSGGNCKVDTVEAYTERVTCPPVCPHPP